MSISLSAILSRLDEPEPQERLVVTPMRRPRTPNENGPSGGALEFHLGSRFAILRRKRATQHDPLAKESGQDVVLSELFIPRGGTLFLHAHQFILGTTSEWIGVPANLRAYATARSRWGRRGLQIATATAVAPWSAGTVTLELMNQSEVAIVLRPGAKIGQLIFHEIDPEPLGSRVGSPFLGAVRPILGGYTKSESEDDLLQEDSLTYDDSPSWLRAS